MSSSVNVNSHDLFTVPSHTMHADEQILHMISSICYYYVINMSITVAFYSH